MRFIPYNANFYLMLHIFSGSRLCKMGKLTKKERQAKERLARLKESKAALNAPNDLPNQVSA